MIFERTLIYSLHTQHSPRSSPACRLARHAASPGAARPLPGRGRYAQPMLGGSWDLVTADDWAYDPTYSPPAWPYVGYPSYKSGYRYGCKQAQSPLTIQVQDVMCSTTPSTTLTMNHSHQIRPSSGSTLLVPQPAAFGRLPWPRAPQRPPAQQGRRAAAKSPAGRGTWKLRGVITSYL